MPVSCTDTAETAAVEVDTASNAVAAPLDAGAKLTSIVQLAPLARVAPQLVVPKTKLEAAVPLKAKLTPAIADPPLLVTVRILAALVDPDVC